LRYWTGRIGITFKPTESIDNYLMLFDTDEHDNGTGFVGEAVNSGRANDSTGIAYNQLYGIYNFVHGTPPFSLANIANPCAALIFSMVRPVAVSRWWRPRMPRRAHREFTHSGPLKGY